MSEHTKTPLRITAPVGSLIDDAEGMIYVAFYGQWARERAAHIVHCVNSHNELLAIIEGLLDVQNGCPLPKYTDDFNAINARARAALKAAGGPP